MAIQVLLESLFRHQPPARNEVLAHIFNALGQHVSCEPVQAALISSLRVIVRTHMLALRAHAEPLAHGISLLWLLPLALAKQVRPHRNNLTPMRPAPTQLNAVSVFPLHACVRARTNEAAALPGQIVHGVGCFDGLL